MTGSNVLRLAPFCLLLLAGNVFADTNSVSEADISNYAKVLSITIKNTGGRVFNAYKGKSCVVKMHLARDGSLSGFSTENGASDLCNKLSDVMIVLKSFPLPLLMKFMNYSKMLVCPLNPDICKRKPSKFLPLTIP